jgi:hypothetical protein
MRFDELSKKFVKKFTIGIQYLKEAQESTGKTISVNDYHYLGKRMKRTKKE